jgi:hypothetical protein
MTPRTPRSWKAHTVAPGFFFFGFVGEITKNLRKGALHVLTRGSESDTGALRRRKGRALRRPGRAAPVVKSGKYTQTVKHLKPM